MFRVHRRQDGTAAARSGLGGWLMVLGAAKICAAKLLLPWSYGAYLDQPMAQRYERWFYVGIAMFLLGLILTWTKWLASHRSNS